DFDIHQATFDVDERAIGVGVRVMAATALAALQGGSSPESVRNSAHA
ncbi:MAG TPA: amidohydrolase, partial [Streptosporangiaceae bacterium]|nr:amidohydrolase [Streptosporangiaceae bacterium]